MREGRIVLVLSCHSGEVRGLFCKNARARDFPPRADSTWVGVRGPRVWAARENSFFHKELEIVF